MRWATASILLFCTLCAGLCSDAQAQDRASGPDVIVVQSYHEQYVWCQAVNQGLESALKGLPAQVETVYLDAKRDLDPESLRARALGFLERIEAARPRLVVTVDDAAQAYLAAPLLKGRKSPQVIFCGVNAPLAHYGFPAANVSGVRERWHFRETFALAHKILPKARRVTLLTDMSESSGYVLGDMREERSQGGPFALPQVKVERTGSYQQWQRLVRAAQTQADVLALGIYLSLRDEATGRVVPADEVAAWVNSANRLPTVGFADYVLGHGQLCGVLESGREQGQLAGAMARQVLERGAAAGGLPVRLNRRGVVVVNLKTAQRLNFVVPYEIIEAAETVIR